MLVSIGSLPRTALEAIYRATTGKTANLTRALRKNVVIYQNDVENLHQKICDQLNHYEILAGPTVTIAVQSANDQKHQYNSWINYSNKQPDNNEITSDITMKYEVLLNLPRYETPQRMTVTINLDSGLPLLNKKEEETEFFPVIFSDVGSWSWVADSKNFYRFC